MSHESTTLAQALLAMNDHFGAVVRVSLNVRDTEGLGVMLSILEVEGELSRDESAAAYTVGLHLLDLGPAGSAIAKSLDWLEFRLAYGVVLAIHWFD